MDTSERRQALRARLARGLVIPAHPLALTAERRLDERHQRALTRYYLDAGAGGLAVGVHTTQFAIRDPRHGLYRPVLELAADTVRSHRSPDAGIVLVAGVVGETKQAVAEATLAKNLGYHVALLGLGALKTATEAELIAHCRTVAEVMPLFGFYLQPAVGGRVLSYAFWREFATIPNVWAIKVAPFNRYQTLDVVRAVAESGRPDIALYTGNDDSIIIDLLSPFPVTAGGSSTFVGGLLGQWAVWTAKAVDMHARVRLPTGPLDYPTWLQQATALTDANSAIFDAANGFAGCIAGIHEILRRQGLMQGTWCLDPAEGLSPGQAAELDRVCALHPQLADDEFVKANLDRWLA